MTVAKEEPGLLFLTCDSCGERHLLDELDPDEPDPDELAEIISDLRFSALPLERQKFATDYESRRYTVEYREHHCEDCS